jgi:hypothetical protein
MKQLVPILSIHTFKRLVLCLVALLTVAGSTAQTYFEQLVPLNSGINFTNVVFSGALDTQIVMVDNTLITKLNQKTGMVNSCQRLRKYNAQVEMKAGVQFGDHLYLVGRSEDSSRMPGYIMKYSIISNRPLLQVSVFVNAQAVSLSSIACDRNQNLYTIGSMYDSSLGFSDMIITKMDSNCSVKWAKRLRHSLTDGVTPIEIRCGNESVVYFTGMYYPSSVFGGVPVTGVMDSNGTVVQAIAFQSLSGPRFVNSYSAICNGKLVTAYKTFLGPSDPGPMLVKIRDRTLTGVYSGVLSGNDASGISCNNKHITISGQAYRTSGQIGFRSTRLDTALNVVGGRYFNTIATSRGGYEARCFLNKAGNSFHFIQLEGYNQLYVAKTDTNEVVNCNDTTYNPSVSSSQFVDSAFSFSSTPITANTRSLIFYMESLEVLVHASCSPSGMVDLGETAGEFDIYPNPATDIAHIRYTGNNSFTVQLTDVAGRVLLHVQNERELDVTTLAPGVYFVKIITTQGSFSKVLVKE